MLPVVPIVVAGSTLALSFVRGMNARRKRKNKAFDSAGMTRLQRAVVAQNISRVSQMLSEGCFVDERDKSGMPTFFYAVKTKNVELVQLFIYHHVDVNAMDKNGRTALFYADDIACANQILAEKILVDSRDVYGQTPLFFVSNDEVALRLVALKADCNARNENGFTPLFYARTPGIAQSLIDGGADIYAVSNNGTKIFDFVQEQAILRVLYKNIVIEAIRTCDVGKLHSTLCAHPEIANERDKDGEPLLKLVVDSKKAALLKVFIEDGADVNVLDAKGEPLIFYCIITVNVDAVRLFCKAGCDVNVRNASDRTTLRTAFFYRNDEILECLVRAGADVHQVDNDGKTPLFYAHRRGLIEAMVQHGADPNDMDNEGKPPIFYAESREDISALVDMGADVNARDGVGRTPLFYASSRRTIWPLLKNGADTKLRDYNGCDVFEANSSVSLRDEIYKYINALIVDGDIVRLRQMLENSNYVNMPYHCSFLFKAVERDNVECFKLLIDAGADVNVVSRLDVLIVRAIKLGNVEIVRMLLKKDVLIARPENYSDDKRRKTDDSYSLFHHSNEGRVSSLYMDVLNAGMNSSSPEIFSMLKWHGVFDFEKFGSAEKREMLFKAFGSGKPWLIDWAKSVCETHNLNEWNYHY